MNTAEITHSISVLTDLLKGPIQSDLKDATVLKLTRLVNLLPPTTYKDGLSADKSTPKEPIKAYKAPYPEVKPSDAVQAPTTVFKDENGKTVRYIGTYATGGNVGDIWTKMADGTYTSDKQPGSHLSQADIDGDVRNGYLAPIIWKSKRVQVEKPKRTTYESDKVESRQDMRGLGWRYGLGQSQVTRPDTSGKPEEWSWEKFLAVLRANPPLK